MQVEVAWLCTAQAELGVILWHREAWDCCFKMVPGKNEGCQGTNCILLFQIHHHNFSNQHYESCTVQYQLCISSFSFLGIYCIPNKCVVLLSHLGWQRSLQGWKGPETCAAALARGGMTCTKSINVSINIMLAGLCRWGLSNQNCILIHFWLSDWPSTSVWPQPTLLLPPLAPLPEQAAILLLVQTHTAKAIVWTNEQHSYWSSTDSSVILWTGWM